MQLLDELRAFLRSTKVSETLSPDLRALLSVENTESQYASAAGLLRQAQVGLRSSPKKELPAVIDVGGFDAIEAGVVGKLVNLEALSQLVAATPCRCESPAICPRRLAWKQL